MQPSTLSKTDVEHQRFQTAADSDLAQVANLYFIVELSLIVALKHLMIRQLSLYRISRDGKNSRCCTSRSHLDSDESLTRDDRT